MTKIKKILAEASLLSEKIQSAVKNRENLLKTHISERVASGSHPDEMHLSTTRDGHVLDVMEIFTTFLRGLDLTETLSFPTKEAGHPPVDQAFFNPELASPVIVIGKKPEVYVYLKPAGSDLHLRDYLDRTGVDPNTFLEDPGYEIGVFNVTQLVANEVYHIPDGAFRLADKQEMLAEASKAVITAESNLVGVTSSVTNEEALANLGLTLSRVDDVSTAIRTTPGRRSTSRKKKSTSKRNK